MIVDGGLVYRFVATWFVGLVASCFTVCDLLICCGGLLSVICFGGCVLCCLCCVGVWILCCVAV